MRTVALGMAFLIPALATSSDDAHGLNRTLREALTAQQFTGRIAQTLEPRLGRQINRELAELGKMLIFDQIPSLHSDNSCSGCHSPTNGFGDSQSIAIGIQNNGVVGPGRKGPRNQRRTPMLINTAFYPKLMWNGRFSSLSGDPFDNSAGFEFPPPEGTQRFPANDPVIRHLLIAQAHMPPTEMTEVAGFTGTRGTISPLLDQFDDGKGSPVPAPDSTGTRDEPIRQAVLKRLNSSPAYKTLFGNLFPAVAAGEPITFVMFGQAVAEFEFTLVFADAPIDQFARGDDNAMSPQMKRGALLFFGKGNCVACHAVAGQSNEMFTDFQNHRIAVPQLAPFFGVGFGDVLFDGNGEDEDFAAEQITGNSADRYKFRTSPLRNLALQPAFFHDGAFTRVEDAILHHLNVYESLSAYNPVAAGVATDLTWRNPPRAPLLEGLDPALQQPLVLSKQQFDDLVVFVRDALLDARARNLCNLIPTSLPSGARIAAFQACLGSEQQTFNH